MIACEVHAPERVNFVDAYQNFKHTECPWCLAASAQYHKDMAAKWQHEAELDLIRIRELEAALAEATDGYHRWHDAFMTLKYPNGAPPFPGATVTDPETLCEGCPPTGEGEL